MNIDRDIDWDFHSADLEVQTSFEVFVDGCWIANDIVDIWAMGIRSRQNTGRKCEKLKNGDGGTHDDEGIGVESARELNIW